MHGGIYFVPIAVLPALLQYFSSTLKLLLLNINFVLLIQRSLKNNLILFELSRTNNS